MARAKASGVNGVTSRDVARVANVSQALVSRAFTGNGRIAPETRERILKVAAEIGWQPNALAASMVTGDAPLVAVITTRLSFDWRAQVLSHLLKAFEEWHLKPLLFYAESDDEVDRLLGETISWRTRGVIVTAGTIMRERAEAILSRGQFFAALNRPANHAGAFSVATDNPLGGAMAATLLMDEGRQQFPGAGRARGQLGQFAAHAAGFVDALHGARARSAWSGTTTPCRSRRARHVRRDISTCRRRSGPMRCFPPTTRWRSGFIDGLRESGVAIPADLSVIGFDNLAASSWTPYQLTTFEQPLDEMVSRVLGHIETHQQDAAAPPAAQSSAASHRRRRGHLLRTQAYGAHNLQGQCMTTHTRRPYRTGASPRRRSQPAWRWRPSRTPIWAWSARGRGISSAMPITPSKSGCARRLRSCFPQDGIIGEEFGGTMPEAGFCWLMDPIDGTVNFARKLGYFCVSLALLARWAAGCGLDRRSGQ